MKLHLTGGIGDWVTIEAHLSPEQRDSITDIYWAKPSNIPCRPLLEPILRQLYPNVKHHHPPVPPNLIHHFSWLNLIQTGALQYHPSRFATEQLATLDHLDLPQEYIAIHPSTHLHRKHAIRWEDVLPQLDRPAVVLGDKPTELPDHPLLLDYQGKTTLAESFEVVKQSVKYLGIDSCLACVAHEVVPCEVYTYSHHLYPYPWIWYGGHEDYSWVKWIGQGEPLPRGKREMPVGGNWYLLKCDCLVGRRVYQRGELLCLTDDRLVQQGAALPLDLQNLHSLLG